MTTKPTTDKQTNNWPTIFLETEYFRFKKTGPGQTRTGDICPARHIRYPQAKLARNAKKAEYIMKQEEMSSYVQMSPVDKVVCGKSLVIER